MLRRVSIAVVVLTSLFGTNCAFRPIFHPPTASSEDNTFATGNSDPDARGHGEADLADDPASQTADANGHFGAVPAADAAGASDATESRCAEDAGSTDARVKDDGPLAQDAAPLPVVAGPAGNTYLSPE